MPRFALLPRARKPTRTIRSRLHGDRPDQATHRRLRAFSAPLQEPTAPASRICSDASTTAPRSRLPISRLRPTSMAAPRAAADRRRANSPPASQTPIFFCIPVMIPAGICWRAARTRRSSAALQRLPPCSAALPRIVRGRAINPRFIAGLMRHGARGAAELAETVDRLVAFAETSGAVPGTLLDLVHAAYLGDASVRDFLLRENP